MFEKFLGFNLNQEYFQIGHLQVMVPYNFTEFINDLTYLVKNNFIPMARIDDAVERILLVKFTMGLFENPYTDFSLIKEVGSQVGVILYISGLIYSVHVSVV